jgi:hypothetical protein
MKKNKCTSMETIKITRLIRNIYKTIKSSFNKYNYNESVYDIGILNRSNKPLLFQILKEYHNKNILNKVLSSLNKNDKNTLITIIKNDDLHNFYLWMIDNQTKLSLPHYSKSSIGKQLLNNPNREELNRLIYDNNFVSIDVHLYSESKYLILKKVRYEGINISMYYEKGKATCNINNVIHICKFLSLLSNRKQPIKIVILCSNIKKNIKWGNRVLGPINANSGSTLIGSFINLWRKEEFEKVLIHELIHYFELDYGISTIFNDKVRQYYNRHFNINGSTIPNETYTDMLTIIIHTIYIIFMTGKSINEFSNLIEIEIGFSILQVSKILRKFGYNTFNELYDKNKSINQYTSIFSYYIAKSALLFNMNSLLDYLGDDITVKINVDDYIKLLDSSLKDRQYQVCINNMLDIVNTSINKYIWNTLRMSCLQIN